MTELKINLASAFLDSKKEYYIDVIKYHYFKNNFHCMITTNIYNGKINRSHHCWEISETIKTQI